MKDKAKISLVLGFILRIKNLLEALKMTLQQFKCLKMSLMNFSCRYCAGNCVKKGVRNGNQKLLCKSCIQHQQLSYSWIRWRVNIPPRSRTIVSCGKLRLDPPAPLPRESFRVVFANRLTN